MILSGLVIGSQVGEIPNLSHSSTSSRFDLRVILKLAGIGHTGALPDFVLDLLQAGGSDAVASAWDKIPIVWRSEYRKAERATSLANRDCPERTVSHLPLHSRAY